MVQKMDNFDDVVKRNIKEHNPDCPKFLTICIEY